MTSRPARADDVYTPVNLPACKMYLLGNKVEVCGYTDVEDYKKVLTADADLTHAKIQLKNEQDRSAALQAQSDALKIQVDHYAATQSILVAFGNKRTQDLIDLDKKYQDERVKPVLGSAIPWTIAAAATAVLAGFIIHDLL